MEIRGCHLICTYIYARMYEYIITNIEIYACIKIHIYKYKNAYLYTCIQTYILADAITIEFVIVACLYAMDALNSQ